MESHNGQPDTYITLQDLLHQYLPLQIQWSKIVLLQIQWNQCLQLQIPNSQMAVLSEQSRKYIHLIQVGLHPPSTYEEMMNVTKLFENLYYNYSYCTILE